MRTSSSGRESRRSSKSEQDAPRTSDRHEKARSTQVHGSVHSGARRGSVQQSQEGLQSVPERPRLKSRTNSAPLVETRRAAPGQPGGSRDGGAHKAAESVAKSRTSPAGAAMADGQDEDEVAGVVGAVRQYEPFQSPEVGCTV